MRAGGPGGPMTIRLHVLDWANESHNLLVESSRNIGGALSVSTPWLGQWCPSPAGHHG